MATNTPNTPEEKQFLVLGDEEGTYYAIPFEIVEQHKATGEQLAQIEQALSSDDVAGYSTVKEDRTTHAYGKGGSSVMKQGGGRLAFGPGNLMNLSIRPPLLR